MTFRILLPVLLALLLTSFLSAQETRTFNHSVFFASASDRPDAEQLTSLEDFAANLTAYADYTLRVEAYTDEQGSEAYNKDLADRRAATVRRLLAASGVNATTVDVLTYGEQRARRQTTADDQRRDDRRVDLLATVVWWDDATTVLGTASAEQETIVTVDPTQRQQFVGNRGGAFNVPPNALIRADGTPARGPVTIAVTEAYTLADMILAGLTTTAGDRRLETGGMFRLTATDSDGEELNLRPGVGIRAAIPTASVEERMQLFAGADHDGNGAPMDWTELAGGRVAADLDAMFLPPAPAGFRPESPGFVRRVEAAVNSSMLVWIKENPRPKKPRYERLVSVREPRPVDLDRITYKPKGISKLFNGEKAKARKLAKRKQQAESGNAVRIERYQRNVEANKITERRNQIARDQYEAALTEWQFEYDTFRENLLNGKLEQARLAYEQDQEANRREYEAYLAKREQIRQQQIESMEELLATSSDAVSTRMASRYFMTVTQLGWTNVDRYATPEEPMQVFARIENATEEATVLYLPLEERSVVPFGYDQDKGQWQRAGVPAGRPFRVIAYEVIDGQMMLAQREFSGEALAETVSLSYEPVAMKDLRSKLAELTGG